jgi:hypothetical protein
VLSGAQPVSNQIKGTSMECKTVKVVSPVSDENPTGYIVINESDLTEAHELFEESASEAVAKKSVKKKAE